MEPKELPHCTIPLLILIAYNWQLEILVTTLVIYLKTAVSIDRLNLHHLAHKHDTGLEDLLLISSTLADITDLILL